MCNFDRTSLALWLGASGLAAAGIRDLSQQKGSVGERAILIELVSGLIHIIP
jgi:hypothetical protein